MTDKPFSLRDKRFLNYLAVCFVNAFDDNAFKAIVLLIVQRNATEEGGALLISMTSGVFILPFLIFSSWAGDLADRYSKKTVIVVMQSFEVFAMALGAYAFHIGSMPLMLAALFWAGAQAAFYSPGKYGIIPETIPPESLSRVNGILQALTNAAILLGIAFGGLALRLFDGDPTKGSLACAVFASIGVTFAVGIWRVAPANANARVGWLNPFGSVFHTLKKYLPDPRIGAPLVGLAFFWFLAATVQMDLLLFAKHVLYLGHPSGFVEFRTSLMLTILLVGIGLGSLLAGRWSGPKVEIGLVPLGALGTAMCLIDLGLFGISETRVWIDLFLVGISSGIFSVPLTAAVQSRAPVAERGGVIAASNFLTFLGIFAASAVLPLLMQGIHLGPLQVPGVGLKPSGVFIALGVLCLFVGIALCLWLADFFIRFVMWLLTHTIYDISIRGREHVPERGPALFVANHVSFADALLIGSCMQRFIRYIMLERYYSHPAFNGICRMMKAIPIAPGNRESTREAMARAVEELKKGHIVCIFAEGEITRTGNMLTFRRGFENVAQEAGAPIIPVHLGGVWGSIFSFDQGRFIWKRPRQIPYPVTVSFGAPLPSTASSHQVRQAVAELGADAMAEKMPSRGTLGRGFVRAARRRWFRPAVADSMGRSLTYGRLLAVVHLLSRRLPKEEYLGIVLPPSVAGVLVNVAATIGGRIPVNLNFTASQESVSSAIERCRIKNVVTSRAFKEKVKVDFTPANEIMIEDLIAEIPKWKILFTEIYLFLLPLMILRKVILSEEIQIPAKDRSDRTATVIFSSGSTGSPKGIVLSHANIRANIEGLAQVFDIRPSDKILGALPFFHSFGFTATLWFPLVAGFSAVYHPNPLDAKAITRLASSWKATILVATPTFASSYIRKATPEEFSSLRLTFVGAEKLQTDLGRSWREKYGSPLLEGYGATECAPVVSVNLPQLNKEGSIGHPIPGVAVRVVHTESGEVLESGQEGMLEVKGANVMRGYLGEPERTAAVVRDGWYSTGDIATMDRDGYIRLTGRLSRFSKIAGEMVPHGRIEEELLKVLGELSPTLVVTGIADPEKGEKLVVLHTQELDADELISSLRASGLPNLWIPRKDSFYRVESLPVLGTGKFDLQGIKALAEKKASEVQNNKK